MAYLHEILHASLLVSVISEHTLNYNLGYVSEVVTATELFHDIDDHA